MIMRQMGFLLQQWWIKGILDGIPPLSAEEKTQFDVRNSILLMGLTEIAMDEAQASENICRIVPCA